MPAITLGDLSLRNCGLSPRVADLRHSYFRAVPEVCVERARLVTEYSRQHGLFRSSPISILDKARLYRWVLEHRRPVVRHRQGYAAGMQPFQVVDTSPFAGSTTSKFKGVPLFPEFMALSVWPELHSLPRRRQNPYQLGEAEAEELNRQVFPHWLDYSITEIARERCHADNLARLGLHKHAPELKLLSRLVFFLASKANCISHTIPDFSQAVGRGLRELVTEAARRGAEATEPRKVQFYAAIGEALEGIIAYGRNLAAEAERLAEAATDPGERQDLLDLASIHRRVPEQPARTFREGLTTVWLCWTAIHLENPDVGLSLGRLDQLLYPLYKQDVDAGRHDPQQAVDLLAHLWLKIGDHVPAVPESAEQLFGGTGSNQAITLGGIDQAGRDAVNDLTYVMLRATELMKLRDPNLNARYHSGVNPPEYLRRLCEVNLTTGATPAIHNDRAVIKALMSAGDTCEQARDYGIIGCVEPASNGRSYTASAAVLLNLASALELALYDGRHRLVGLDTTIGPATGDPRGFGTFAEFRSALRAQIAWLADQSTRLNDVLGRVHQDFYPTPILSALMEGPMLAGRDVVEGGAAINASGVTVIGLADVADSLSAIQRLVYDERAVTFADLLQAVDRDFAADEALRLRLGNPDKTPKYGTDDPVADENARWLVDTIHEIFGSHVTYRGGRFRVGYWTMTNHAGFGRLMPALPSGRRAHENLASGITPVSGTATSLNATLNAVARLPAASLDSGVALNLKFTPVPGDPERTLDDFAASVEAYFDTDGGRRDGGMEIQFNVTSRDTFIDAVAHPEEYPELLVRVSGYTAYFKDLTPQMQKEIIERTEYLLQSGEARPFELFPIATE